MMADFRKDALIKTLREEYGITTSEQLLDAIRNMKKLDITQFVLRPEAGRTKNYDLPNTNLPVAAGAWSGENCETAEGASS